MKTSTTTWAVRTTALVLTSVACVVAEGRAQSIASRVSGVSNGTVRMSFAVKPGICGSGNSIRHMNNRGATNWGDSHTSRDVEWDSDCNVGPARLVIDRQNGE